MILLALLQTLTVEAGTPLVVRYRVWIQDGPIDPALCAAKSADFVSPPTVTVK